MMMIRSLMGLAFGIAAVAGPAAAQQGAVARERDPDALVDIVARPVRNGAVDVQYVEVVQEFRRKAGATAADFALRTPDSPGRRDNVSGSRPALVMMVDAQGPVAVEIRDTTPGTPISGGANVWRAARPVTFPVTIRYYLPPWPPGTRTNPSFMLRSVAGAVSAAGGGLFLTAN